MVQTMAITSPIPVFQPLDSGWVVYGPENGYNSPIYVFYPLESGWVVYGPENGYNFSYSRFLTVGIRVGRLWSRNWL